jgi:hypothetical protein
MGKLTRSDARGFGPQGLQPTYTAGIFALRPPFRRALHEVPGLDGGRDFLLQLARNGTPPRPPWTYTSVPHITDRLLQKLVSPLDIIQPTS